MLAAGCATATLIVDSDPFSILPGSIVKNLQEIPVISIDPYKTLTSRHSKVYINTAISGVEAGGTATRMDRVKVSFEPVIEAKRPSDETILEKIMEAL